METLLLGAGESGAGRDEAREGELRMVGEEMELDCRRETDADSDATSLPGSSRVGEMRDRRYCAVVGEGSLI